MRDYGIERALRELAELRRLVSVLILTDRGSAAVVGRLAILEGVLLEILDHEQRGGGAA